MNKVTTFHLLLLACFGVITRFVFLDSVPANLQPDGVDSIRLYAEHRHRNDFAINSTQHNGSHIVNQMIVGIPWEIFGRQYWAVRLGSAVLSIVCTIIFYLMVRSWTHNAKIAFITSLLLLVNPWFLNFSRSGWDNITNCVTVTILLFAFSLPNSKQTTKWLLFLLVTCVSPYLYHSGKIVALVATFALFGTMMSNRFSHKKRLGLIVLTVSILMFCATPLLMISSETQLGRIGTVSIVSESDVWSALQENFVNNALGFLTFQPDQWYVGLNSRYLPLDGWVVHPVIVFLYWIGTLYSLRKRWWLVLVGVILIYPVNLFSRATPDAARTLHALPYIYLMVAFGLLGLLKFAHFISNRYHLSTLRGYELGTLVAKGALAIVVISLAVQQFLTYWIWITNPTTLRGREPAIYQYEYQQWLRDIDSQLDEMGRTLSIYEWKDET